MLKKREKSKEIKSVYVHIPFCSSICSYCDFCKFYTNHQWIEKYLKSLSNEIHKYYNNDIIKTLYIGGGTPSSLSIDELNKLFNILKIFKLEKDYEFTFECNIEDITITLLELLKSNRVNRISIGIQSFNNKYLSLLNRNHKKDISIEKIELVKKYFNNINIDLIYAIPGQTLEALKKDLDILLNLDIPHISTYSLIIENNTKLYIDNVKNIDEELDYNMYKLICTTLKDYNHYEISNFSKKGYESKHNLNYWDNNNYYGFGCGASGYINNTRYDNTRSITNYINGKYRYEKEVLTKKKTIENEFILGLRKTHGIKKDIFKTKYNTDIHSDIVNKLLSQGKLIEDNKYIYINPKYIYVSNNILINFIN